MLGDPFFCTFGDTLQIDNGWLNNDMCPLISLNKAAILASVMADILGLNPHWAAFEELWNAPDLAKKFSNTKIHCYYDTEMKKFSRAFINI